MVDIIWDAIVWQHPFLISGQFKFDFWNSIQKYMITIFNTYIADISFIPEYGSKQLHE